MRKYGLRVVKGLGLVSCVIGIVILSQNGVVLADDVGSGVSNVVEVSNNTDNTYVTDTTSSQPEETPTTIESTSLPSSSTENNSV